MVIAISRESAGRFAALRTRFPIYVSSPTVNNHPIGWSSRRCASRFALGMSNIAAEIHTGNSTKGESCLQTCEPIAVESRNYGDWSPSELISRITTLEGQLRKQNAQLAALISAQSSQPSAKTSASPTTPPPQKVKSLSNPFDFASHPTRLVALKFSYLGAHYNGFEHANGTVTPLPTVEEVIWKALRKTRLIDPLIPEGCDASYDVMWDPKERLQHYGNGPGKTRLELTWEGCEYSKCGRTDRGVSAFGQVIGLRLRSRIKSNPTKSVNHVIELSSRLQSDAGQNSCSIHSSPSPSLGDGPEHAIVTPEPELPYATLLNSVLPPHLRIHAVCIMPPPDFDARFSCIERRYKYLFTNPAFCPPPAIDRPRSSTASASASSTVIPGYLDIVRMRQAARKFQGLHDFRNFCKIDPSKAGGAHGSSFVRRVTFADVVPLSDPLVGLGVLASGEESLKNRPQASSSASDADVEGVKMYAFVVHGSAFLWHQVRCMVAILFLVGQGLEDAEVVDRLLDVDSEENQGKGRPDYLMAHEEGLVLWDCRFGQRRRGFGERGRGPAEGEQDGNDKVNGDHNGGQSGNDDVMKWTYVGDVAMRESLALYYGGKKSREKTDGKYGLGGLVEESWALWRQARMDELLKRELLGIALRLGGDSDEMSKPLPNARKLGQGADGRERTKVFDGSERGRNVGRYVPVMQRSRLDTPEVMWRKYVEGKGARRVELKERAMNGGVGGDA